MTDLSLLGCKYILHFINTFSLLSYNDCALIALSNGITTRNMPLLVQLDMLAGNTA